MLTVLVNLWAVSLVVLAVLLAAVIAVQGTLAHARRLGGAWTASRAAARAASRPSPRQVPEPARG